MSYSIAPDVSVSFNSSDSDNSDNYESCDSDDYEDIKGVLSRVESKIKRGIELTCRDDKGVSSLDEFYGEIGRVIDGHYAIEGGLPDINVIGCDKLLIDSPDLKLFYENHIEKNFKTNLHKVVESVFMGANKTSLVKQEFKIKNQTKILINEYKEKLLQIGIFYQKYPGLINAVYLSNPLCGLTASLAPWIYSGDSLGEKLFGSQLMSKLSLSSNLSSSLAVNNINNNIINNALHNALNNDGGNLKNNHKSGNPVISSEVLGGVIDRYSSLSLEEYEQTRDSTENIWREVLSRRIYDKLVLGCDLRIKGITVTKYSFSMESQVIQKSDKKCILEYFYESNIIEGDCSQDKFSDLKIIIKDEEVFDFFYKSEEFLGDFFYIVDNELSIRLSANDLQVQLGSALIGDGRVRDNLNKDFVNILIKMLSANGLIEKNIDLALCELMEEKSREYFASRELCLDVDIGGDLDQDKENDKDDKDDKDDKQEDRKQEDGKTENNKNIKRNLFIRDVIRDKKDMMGLSKRIFSNIKSDKQVEFLFPKDNENKKLSNMINKEVTGKIFNILKDRFPDALKRKIKVPNSESKFVFRGNDNKKGFFESCIIS